MLVRYVSRCEHEPIPCADGESVFQALDGVPDRPVAIITDLYLPRNDGLAVLARLQHHLGKVPGLVITGEPLLRTEQVERLKALGASIQFRPKPIDLEVVRHFLEHARVAEQIARVDEHDLVEVLLSFSTEAGLSLVERELLPMIVRDLTHPEIAARLNISVHTLRSRSRTLIAKSATALRRRLRDGRALRAAVMEIAGNRAKPDPDTNGG
jgi:FixJ family two-component response regulator